MGSCESLYVEVLQLQSRYALSLDTKDWHLVEQVFAPDARVTYHGTEYRGVASIRRYLELRLSHVGVSQHLISNLVLRTEGGDCPNATCAFRATIFASTGHLMRETFGFFHDTVDRVGSGWRIVERVVDAG